MSKPVRQMLSPVECAHCGATYDLTEVETVARYADCTVFKTPCCGRTVDDRRWKSLPDIWPLELHDRPRRDKHGRWP